MILRRFGMMMLLTLASSCLFAAELQRVILQDGSSVNAEVLSLNNGVYTLKSPTLGKVKVSADQVQAVQSLRSASMQTQNTASNSQIDMEKIQSSLLANGDTVNIIMALRNDPSVKAILADKNIMAAISRGDYESLANNPKIKSLMKNAEIKKITSNIPH